MTSDVLASTGFLTALAASLLAFLTSAVLAFLDDVTVDCFVLVEVEELLLFLVLDVFKCMGPVLEPVLGRASGSILRADLALATMPVLMEPDFT